MVLKHKIFISSLKYFPLIMAISYVASSILLFLGIPILCTWLWGTSLLSTIFILIASYTFKFCNYHRIFIYYSLGVEIFKNILFVVGVNVLTTYSLLLIIISFFIVCCIALYQHLKQNGHNK